MSLKHLYPILWAVLSIGTSAYAQRFPENLLLQSGKAELHDYVPPEMAQGISSDPAYHFGAFKYFILHFEEMPDHTTRETLLRLGVDLQDYLGEKAFIAAIPTDVDLGRLPVAGFMPIRPAYKISRTLETWEHLGNIEVAVLPFNNILPEDLAADLTRLGHTIIGKENNALWLSIFAPALHQLASHPGIYFVEPKPGPPIPEGLPGRTLLRVNLVNPLIAQGFDGSGVGISIGDDGGVNHIDFMGRLVDHTSSQGGEHGDMTTGIAVGAGNLDPLGVGIATGADLHLFHIGDYTHINNAISNYLTYGTVITNTSYGESCGGIYSYTAQSLDIQVVQQPALLHFFSAGNSSTENCDNPYGILSDPFGVHYGNITGGRKAAKHSVVIGNVFYDDMLRFSSSRGPTYDGRTKPELCGQGQENYTTNAGNTYQIGGGTSAASPSVAGVAALLYQAYRVYNIGQNPSGFLIKAVMLATAQDLGRPGPDFDYGFGRPHAGRALELLQQHWHMTGAVVHGGQQTHTISVPSGTGRLKVLVYWPDPAGSPLAAKALVNDLDMTVQSPSGQITYPLVLSRAIHIDSITRPAYPGLDRVNVTEMVQIDNPTAGNYTVRISGYEVPQGPQSYYIVYHFERDEVKIAYPIGGEGFVPGETEVIRWDALRQNTPFTLEYSTDNGVNWQTIANNVPGDKRYYNWVVPNTVTGKAFVRIRQGAQTSASPAPFSIVGLPSFTIVSTGSNQARISWNPVPGANRYEVYALGSKYMEVIAVTNDTSYQFNINPWETRWLSVKAGHDNGMRGRRAVAKKYQHQPCEVQITVSLTFDQQPSQSSWKLFNEIGQVAVTGGPYTNVSSGSTLISQLCLPAGCYQFVMYDSGNNGMCCSAGNGGFTITNANGQLVGSGGSFTSQQAVSFCQELAVQPLVINAAQAGSATCSGSGNGWASVSVSGGSGNYTYLWSNGANTSAISGLLPGNYGVTVSDGNSQVSTSVLVGQPPQLQAGVAKTNPTCFGSANGQISLSMSGGVGPYTYQWNTGATTPNISGLSAGSYEVTVVDANGCPLYRNIALGQPAQLIVQTNTTNAVNGNTGAIDLSVTGGATPYTYLWSNGVTTQDLANLPAGVYAATITDAAGCQVFASATVDDNLADYCTTTGASTSFEWIQSLQIGTFGFSSGSNTGYGNFVQLVIPLQAGVSYPSTFTPGYNGAAFTEQWRVWIDFNRDGDFLDNGEQVFASGASNTTVTGSIQIPSTVTPGPTRLRVAMRYGIAPQPCGVFPYGEVEDYTVDITPMAMSLGSQEGHSAISLGQEASMVLFPNPASRQVTLQIAGAEESEATILFVNSQGAVVSRQVIQVEAGLSNHLLALHTLPPGVYWVLAKELPIPLYTKLIIQ